MLPLQVGAERVPHNEGRIQTSFVCEPKHLTSCAYACPPLVGQGCPAYGINYDGIASS